MPEDNGKENLDESCTNKYQKYVVRSYGYKLVCVDDKFSKPFKSYLGGDAVYNFINSMIEESKYCSDVMKINFNKKPVMTKKDNQDYENSTKCWICDNICVVGDVKVTDHCYILGNYRALYIEIDWNIKVKSNHKIPIVFHNLKNYDHTLLCKN